MRTSESFGQWLRRRREEAGVTLRETARRARIAKSYLSRIERDAAEAPPSEAVCEALAEVLGLRKHELCRRAGRVPLRLEQQLLASPSWFKVLQEARLRRVAPSEVLAWVRERPRPQAAE